jgi:hypothetical protein
LEDSDEVFIGELCNGEIIGLFEVFDPFVGLELGIDQ